MGWFASSWRTDPARVDVLLEVSGSDSLGLLHWQLEVYWFYSGLKGMAVKLV